MLRSIAALPRLAAALMVLAGLPAWASQSVDTGLILPTQKPNFHETRPIAAAGSVHGPDSNAPVALEADAMGYDKDNNIAVARGHVVVAQGGHVVNADKITYFQRQNLVVAEGNVSVLQPTGDVYFSDTAVLRDDMQQGVVQSFKARLSDNSVFAAEEAHKIDAATTKLKHAVYTPCKICAGASPFWQIKSTSVTVDERAEDIAYENARLEIGGVPAFYTPYLSIPTPQAGGRSGFLVPEYSSSGNLGRTVKVPYYWRIDYDKDITLTPWYVSQGGWLLQGDYNQLTDQGHYRVQFSGTNPTRLDDNGNKADGTEFRGHIYAKGEEEVGDFSRIGFDINRASDETYLRRYGFGSQRFLFSRLYAEAAEQRNYASAQILATQGLLSTDNASSTPLVLPTLEAYYETQPDANGVRYHVSGNAQSLTRNTGADQQRLSSTVGATLPYVTDGGHVITSTVNLRQDIYQLNDVAVSGNPSYSGDQERTIPQAALEWRYPLIKPLTSGDSLTLEPIVLAVAQPKGSNPVQIANEDNTLIELTDTNLFSIDRLPGLDTVDSSSRAAYGVRSQYLFSGGEAIDALLGQNYSFSETPFPNSSRQGDNASDYIGRIGLFVDPLTLTYRFAADHQTLSTNRNEFTLGFNQPWLNVQTGYRSIRNSLYLRDSEEATLYVGLPLSDEWNLYASGRRDLQLNQMIAAGSGLTYHNECFSLTLLGLRSYTRDRDVEPDTSFTVRIGFKNLGEFGG